MTLLRPARGSVYLAFAAGLLLCAAPVRAVDPQRPLSQCTLDRWQSRDGLPHDNVFAVRQTSDGYLWVGTQEGLCRFDGVRFTAAPLGNARVPLTRSVVSRLERARDGGLWVCTYGGGLWHVHEGRLALYTGHPFGPADNLEAVWEGPTGDLWVSVQGQGVWLLRPGATIVYTSHEGLPSNSVNCLCGTRDGSLWLGTERGLCRLRDGMVTTYTTRDGLPSDIQRTLLEDADGTLWVGTDGGLAQLRDGRFRAYTTTDGLPSNLVRHISPGRAGTLWVATLGGLARLRRGQFEALTHPDSAGLDKVAMGYEDREGSVWIATQAAGLARLKDSLVATWGADQGLKDDFIWSACEGPDGSVWAGTNSGVWRLHEGKLTHYTTRDGLPNNCVRGLFADPEGNLWLATYGGGVARWRDGHFRTALTTRNGLSSNSVYAVFRDRAGTLWVGTRDGGLNAVRDGKVTVYTAPRDLPHETVRCIAEDPSGALWIATHGGLARYQGGRFTSYTTREGLRWDRLLGVTADGAGNVWLASDGGGLGRWRDGRITFYGPPEGLPDYVLYQVVEDRAGDLWLSCNKGIFRLRKKDLDDIDAGRASTLAPILYGTADGMKASECNGGNQSAGCCARDGRLWFPTTRGLVMLDPKALAGHRPPPRVLLEEVLVNREPIDLAQSGTLPAGKREMEFHYTALSFLSPQRLQFRYRLEDYDSDWIPAGTRREAFYTNLPPGKYRFRVQASHGDGAWGEAETSFTFRLNPSFYQTGWFYAACALMTAALVLLGHKVRVELLEARERALQQRVRERTAELLREVQERKQAEASAQGAREEAEAALAQVKQLRGLLPICSYCKKIRDDGDYWHQLEAYLGQHTDAQFSHGICPECWERVVQPSLEGPLPPHGEE